MTGEQLTNKQPKARGLQASLAAPSVSVTIVNHRSRELLRACLVSLRAFPYTLGPMEIVVLDNASDDGSVEMLRDEYPEVVVLGEEIRRGYAANQNLAVASSGGDVVFILNLDADRVPNFSLRAGGRQLQRVGPKSPVFGKSDAPGVDEDGFLPDLESR